MHYRQLKSCVSYGGFLLLLGFAACSRPVADQAERPGPETATPDSATEASVEMAASLPDLMTSPEPLAPGEKIPNINRKSCAGWLNSEPDSGDASLVLLDISSAWCSENDQTFKELVALRDLFSVRDLALISLMSEGKDTAVGYVKEHGITWPVGYGTAPQLIRSLGAGHPQYPATPTLYLLDREGLVLWTDGGRRTSHDEIPDLISELGDAILKHSGAGLN